MKRLCLIATIMVVASSAFAQDHSTQADQRYEEGVTFFRNSDFENARQAFIQAYALVPKTRYLWNLALSEYKSNHPADALNHWRSYFRAPDSDPNDKPKAMPFMEEAGRRSCQLRIAARAGARITVDGVTLQEEAPLWDLVALVPGHHRVSAKLVGEGEKSAEIDGAAGEVKDVSIEFTARVVASGSGHATPKTSPATTGTTAFWNTRRMIGVTVGGIGIVTGGIAIGFVALSASASSDASNLRAGQGSNACVGATTALCSSLQARVNTSVTDGNLAIALGITGAVATVVGITLIALPNHEATVRVAPAPGGLVFTGTF